MEEEEADPNFIQRFTQAYHVVHVPCVLSTCVFGIAANIVNIIVLTRKVLQKNPINIILCGLSIAQLLLLLDFLAYTAYSRFLDGECALRVKSYAWLLYLLLNVNSNLIFHTTALVHTSLLAVFRYIIVHFPGRHFITILRAKIAVITTFLAIPIVCCTFYFNSYIHRTNLTECSDWTPNVATYELNYNLEMQALLTYNFWFFGVVCKLLPCFCLVLVSLLLMWDLKKAAERRKRLKGVRKTSLIKTHAQRQQSRMTYMLLLIVSLFVFVELPQGVVNCLNALWALGLIFKDVNFIADVYMPLGDFFEMMTVLYSSVNFILYCLMSSQFRDTFRQIFLPHGCGGRTTPHIKAQMAKIHDDGNSAVVALIPDGAPGAPPNSKVSLQRDSDHRLSVVNETEALLTSSVSDNTVAMENHACIELSESANSGSKETHDPEEELVSL